MKKVLSVGRRREENDRWALFRSHYGFDAFYCEPGERGAHEKGGVEGEGGRFRRVWLTPVPRIETLAELNAYIERCEARDDRRRITGRLATVGQDWAREQPKLASLPADRFEPGQPLTPMVDHSALVTIRQAKYSVPASLIGRRVRALLRASEITNASASATGRPCCWTTTSRASVSSPALSQARRCSLTPAHEAFWDASRRVNGDAAGTRELLDVLLLHRHLPAAAVIAGIRAAMSVGSVLAEVVAVEARRATATNPATTAGMFSASAAAAATDSALRRLRLPTMRTVLGKAVTAAEKGQLSYAGFLAELLLAEVDDRDRRSTIRRVASAGFPRPKFLDDIDYHANPHLNAATINTLAQGDWGRRGDPLCLIGDSDTGKSHLLIGLGTAVAEKGFRVKYTLATRLVNELVEATDELQLARTIARYGCVDLLIIDELGYMELDKRGAELLFQVLTEREEKASVAIATNQPFSEWTRTFTDPRLCAAIVDHLTFHGTIIETGTDSYRLAHTRQAAV